MIDDALALLRLEMETLWTIDAAGHIVPGRDPDSRPVPLLVVASGDDGLCFAMARDLPASLRSAIGGLLAITTPSGAVGWQPDTAAELLAALSQVASVSPPRRGPSFVVAEELAAPTRAVELRSHLTDGDRERLRGMMPERDRSTLVVPWVVAVVDGRVAAVCETARATPRSVEAGVWTYEPYRHRGFGAAVTAAWARLVSDRTAFYSTDWDNVASQGIARRLGLRPLGQWWQVSGS
jgi:hypothetical protein